MVFLVFLVLKYWYSWYYWFSILGILGIRSTKLITPWFFSHFEFLVFLVLESWYSWYSWYRPFWSPPCDRFSRAHQPILCVGHCCDFWLVLQVAEDLSCQCWEWSFRLPQAALAASRSCRFKAFLCAGIVATKSFEFYVVHYFAS